MGNKVFKALTAVAAVAAAVWLLPKRKKENGGTPHSGGRKYVLHQGTDRGESGCSLPVLLSPRQVDGKGMPSLLHSMALAGLAYLSVAFTGNTLIGMNVVLISIIPK